MQRLGSVSITRPLETDTAKDGNLSNTGKFLPVLSSSYIEIPAAQELEGPFDIALEVGERVSVMPERDGY